MLNDPKMISALIDKAEKILMNPDNEYPWDSIITGVLVQAPNGQSRKMAAVDKNTFRGFHKIDKNSIGAGDVFKHYFTSNKKEILNELKSITSREELHELENEIGGKVKSLLSNIKPTMLMSYNKIRKPIDLYFEHLITMASEISPIRKQLVHFLFLPLDSQMFQHPELFSINELNKMGLSRKSTYTHVASENMYKNLQNIITQKAKSLTQLTGKQFFPIYFDLLWNERFKRRGNNLFETNP